MPLTPGSLSEKMRQIGEKSQIRDCPKDCVICGVHFLVPRHRAKSAKYCSRKCYYKAMGSKGSVVLKCDICEKAYRRPPSHSHYVKKTCSLKCRGIATRTERPISKDYPSVRSWLKRRGLISECSRCGFSEITDILVVHHKDRDRQNNELSNLEVLCPNCHAIEHYAENKEGWTHASTKRQKQRRNISQYIGVDPSW